MKEQKSVLFYHDNKLLRYDGAKLQKADFKENKALYTGAVIPLQHLKTFSFKLPKTLSQDELQMHIEMKMYNEGGLDAEKEYIIDFLQYDGGDVYLIEAFAVLEEECHTLFDDSIKKLDAIDLLFPRFLIYQALYQNQNEFSKKCDLIIYLDEEEAFGAFYFEGRFIASRNINTLSSLSKRSGIELTKLKEYLKQKGFIHANYGLEEMHIIDTLQQIVLKDIEKLIYTINHKRGVFGIEGLGNVYVDFEGESIEGIQEFFLPFGYNDISIDKITIEGVSPQELDLILAGRYLLLLQSQNDTLQKINLSCFERKKPLKEYESFRFIAVAVFTLIVIMTASAYLSYVQQQKEELIAKQKEELKNNRKKIQKIVKRYRELKKEHAQITKQIQEIQKSILVYETTIQAIPMIQEQKKERQRFMNDIVAALAKYRLNTKYIKQKNTKEAEILLISESNNRDTISKFIEMLQHKGYSQVYTNKIYYAYGVYMSKVKVLK